MEKKERKIKGNVATGASSIAGAAVGVVGANVIAQEVNAAEVTEQEEITTQPEREEVVAETIHQDENHDEPVIQPDPEPISADPQVEVLSYEPVTNEDGTQADIAVVAVDGQLVAIGDLDGDEMADVMASDINQNGVIENNEVIDISNEDISMEPFRQEAEMGGDDLYLASNDGQDYVNDANVDAYMA